MSGTPKLHHTVQAIEALHAWLELAAQCDADLVQRFAPATGANWRKIDSFTRLLADAQGLRDFCAELEIYRAPRKQKCKHSPFAVGWHRVAGVRHLSIVDGGAPCDQIREICLHCFEMFTPFGVFPMDQPSRLGVGVQESHVEKP